jgi:hypothetical protein
MSAVRCTSGGRKAMQIIAGCAPVTRAIADEINDLCHSNYRVDVFFPTTDIFNFDRKTMRIM